jgi:uncharacterized membrane protein
VTKVLHYVYDVLATMGLVNFSSVLHFAMTCAGIVLLTASIYFLRRSYDDRSVGNRTASALRVSLVILSLLGSSLAFSGGTFLYQDVDLAISKYMEKSAAEAVDEQDMSVPDTQ